jgi:hypothetical protein
MSEQINKVCANIAQNFSEEQKARARSNIGVDLSSLATKAELDNKQDTIIAGPNIDIYGSTISTEKAAVTAGANVSVTSSLDSANRIVTYNVSATDTTYSAGSGLDLNGTEFSVDTSVIQPKLTAGTNVQINDNVISATDTTYSAGTNVQINDNVISATDTTYSAGNGLNLNGTTFSVDTSVVQPKLTAGSNITIDASNVISATDTTYSAGTNVQINNGVISATDTTYTAGSGLALNGTEFSNTAPNVKSDWNAAAGSPAEILNKPTIPDNVFHAEYGVATVAEISAAKNAGKEVFTLIPGTYFSTVAYLREVTRNGASANFASVTSDGASVKVASVDSSGNWSNATVNLATTTDSSLVQKKNYGDGSPSRVATLLIDSDDPEGYAQVKADNATKGYLVKGPYATLLDSGVNGVGDGDTPVYIDSDGTFKSCNALTAGSNVQINGTTISATDTTYTAGSYISISNANVITNTMHLDTSGLMISYNTLGNSGTTNHSFGPWRIQLVKSAMVTWDSSNASVYIKFAHSDYLDDSIVNGRILVDTYYPWKDGIYTDVWTGHNQWGFTGSYTQGGSSNGFPIYLSSPMDSDSYARACPKSMRGYKFTVNCGINSPDWLECVVNPLYINNNTSLTSNAARLLLQVKYFYT